MRGMAWSSTGPSQLAPSPSVVHRRPPSPSPAPLSTDPRQWPEAIAANPARSLANADLAMDYFAYSPFFDPQSNNNQLRTQYRIDQPSYGSAEEKM
jgi:hypothetical protein